MGSTSMNARVSVRSSAFSCPSRRIAHLDRRPRLAANALHGVVQSNVAGVLAFDAQESVAGLQTCLRRGPSLEHRENRQPAIAGGDLDANAGKPPFGVALENLVLFGVQEHAVRIERIGEPPNRSVDQALLIDRLDVAHFDVRQRARENRQRLEWTAPRRSLRRHRRNEHHSQRADEEQAECFAAGFLTEHGLQTFVIDTASIPG